MAEANNQIARLRKARGLSQQQLADTLGVHWVTVSKLERGKIALTQGWMQRLAEVLDVDDLDILRPQREIAELKLSGAIEDSGKVFMGDVESRGYLGGLTITADFFEMPNHDWLAVQTDSLQPLFSYGDYVRIRWLAAVDWEAAVGKLCCVFPEQGESKVGYLHHSATAGLWTVHVLNGPVLKDVAAKRIGHISSALFGLDLEEAEPNKAD